MKRKTKRLWKLYNELRRLRKINAEIVRDCNEANDRLSYAEAARLRMGDYARSLEEKLRKRGNRVDFCVPNVSAIVSPYVADITAEQDRATVSTRPAPIVQMLNISEGLFRSIIPKTIHRISILLLHQP